jgi:hypothetical protein
MRSLVVANTFVGSDNSQLPITLASFTAQVNPSGAGVLLNWRTLSEIENLGFYVQRRPVNTTAWTEIPNSFIPGHGTTNEPHDYTFVDNTITVAGRYQYRLRQVDLSGPEHFTDPVEVNVPLTSVEEVAPRVFALFQNYPNPFNPETVIKFSVENSAPTKLEVYNYIGQSVATLFNDVAEAGRYYRVRMNGSNLASGVYFYRLTSSTRTDLKKLLLLK